MPIDGQTVTHHMAPLPFHYDMGNLHLGYGCNE